MNHSNRLEEDALNLDQRLRQHPELREQVCAMLDEVENRAGLLNTADEAEDALVLRVREIGRQSLEVWAAKRQAAVQPEKETGRHQSCKKNCAG